MTRTREQSIEDLLEVHPYLIDERFATSRVLRQPFLGDQRPDLMIEHRKRWSIIELKKTPLNDEHIEQIQGYLYNPQTEFKLSRTHYLITKKPRQNPTSMTLRCGPFTIILAFLGQQIPVELRYDRARRIYVPNSSEHSDGEFLKIII